jgi:hypothetical protein
MQFKRYGSIQIRHSLPPADGGRVVLEGDDRVVGVGHVGGLDQLEQGRGEGLGGRGGCEDEERGVKERRMGEGREKREARTRLDRREVNPTLLVEEIQVRKRVESAGTQVTRGHD